LTIEPHFRAILPQFLAIKLHSCERVAFRAISLALPLPLPSKREIEKKERARGQERKRERGEDMKM
jgi:hypothetical protein